MADTQAGGSRKAGGKKGGGRKKAKGPFSGSIVAHRNDRMGGRIVSALNAIRLSRDYDIPYWIFWTTHGLTSPELKVPSDIFDKDFIAARFAPEDEMRPLYNTLANLTTLPPGMTEAAFREEIAKGRSFLSGQAMSAEVLPWEDPAGVRDRLPAALDGIVFNPVVATTMARIDAALAGATLTAYHIRRGDIIHNPRVSNRLWPGKYVPRIFYEVHLESALAAGGARIVIFSDEPREVAAFTAMGPEILSFEDLLGETALTIPQRDFLELYTMSRCRHIVGPGGSAFSGSAAIIGNGVVTSVEDAIGPEGRDRALARLSDRMDRSPGLFHGHGDLGQNFPFINAWHTEKGTEATARRIMMQSMEAGFDRSYIYPLLARSLLRAGDTAGCLRVHDLASERPVYVEDTCGELNCMAALAALREGDGQKAVRFVNTAQWFRPLDPTGHRTAHLLLTMKLLDQDNYFPLDPALIRPKAVVFGQFDPDLGQMDDLGRAAGNGLFAWYPFDLPVRDWQAIQGKKLSRAYFNVGKIARLADQMRQGYSRMADHPSVLSALGGLHRAMGDAGTARDLLNRALDGAPEHPLYLKRMADWHFEKEEGKRGLALLEQAAALAPASPAYRGELMLRSLEAKMWPAATQIALALSQEDHHFPELRLIAARTLRRDRKLLDLALAEVEKGLALVHGGQSLMNMKAMIHLDMGDFDDAAEVYRALLDWGRPAEPILNGVDRLKKKFGREHGEDAVEDWVESCGLAAAVAGADA